MTGNSAAAIHVRGVSHRYGSKLALDDLSFEVARAEICALLGATGSGKTTALQILATLLEPTSGSLEVCGLDAITQRELAKRRIGFAQQLLRRDAGLTLREDLEFFAEAYAVPEGTRQAIEAVLSLTELTAVADAAVESLTLGQQRRFQLSRALLHDPDILILDDPAGNLNQQERISVRDLLLELKELGKTVILSSSARNELTDVCTNLLVLEAGRLISTSSLCQLGQPASRQEASWSLLNAESLRTPGGLLVPDTTVRRLRLRTLKPEPALYQLLLATPFVRHVEIRGLTAWIGYTGDDVFIAELVRHLSSHSISLVAVEPEPHPIDRLLLGHQETPDRGE